MASALDKAHKIVRALVRLAVREPDELREAVDVLSRPQLSAVTVLLVMFDRERQKAGARLEVDLSALDELTAAAGNGPAAVLAVTRGLAGDEVREALVNLLLLHRDLTIAEASARAAAAVN